VNAVSRRTFLKAAALGSVCDRIARPAAAVRQTLYNGITLAEPWPPQQRSLIDAAMIPPYLADPPAVIPIDVGRQLFVDDFLIEESTLNRTYHRAEYHSGNPVLRPTTRWERYDDTAERTHTRSNWAAMVFSDGVFWDPRERLFKMWYMGGYVQSACLALSRDGLNWERPILDVVPGTNVVHRELRDSTTVWLDLAAGSADRYKMAWFDGSEAALMFFTSRDGIHWSSAGKSGPTGDRSTMFYNPFRRVWVFSLRETTSSVLGARIRRYIESPEFPPATRWARDEPVPWTAADRFDPPRPGYNQTPQLYNLDAVAYESLLLGLFGIWRGERADREKPNDIVLGYSRDGFHWWRPDRRPFLGVSEQVGDWNWANVQSAGGCCLVVGDRLYFYVSGRQGVPGTDLPGVCSTGLGTLRRDGFASIDDDFGNRPQPSTSSRVRQLTTRPVRFAGSHLFVNADVMRGRLRVEVLDVEGRVIEPFSLTHAVPIERVDGTRIAVTWQGTSTVADLAGQPVRFRFSLSGGRLYSFWVAASTQGHSSGYVAAGGPEFSGPRDV
jgi:hypothetical protein